MTSCFSHTRFYKIFIEAVIEQMFSGGMKLLIFKEQKNSLKDNKQGGVAGKSSERSPGVRSMSISFINHNVRLLLILIIRGAIAELKERALLFSLRTRKN